MKQVNNRKFEVTARDLLLIGGKIEGILAAIKKYDYGSYNTEELELGDKLALKIVEGMDDWQREHNKGVRLRGDTHIILELYDLHELQKRFDEAMMQFRYSYSD